MQPLPTRDDALDLDRHDPLANKRAEFLLDEDVIYLCGNSLGPMPKSLIPRMDRTLTHDWAKGLIGSQNSAGWFLMPITLGDRMAPILGAGEGEVVVCDSTGLNIYKALHAAISMQPGRNTIVSEAQSFPTDLYMIEGVTSLLPQMQVKLEGRDGDRVEELIHDDTAVVLINHADYRSGALRDVKAITSRAHSAGALVVVDLCHSTGVMPINLHDDNVDFAVGCTYKYLNAGPGSPAYIYVANRHHGKFSQPLTGWHGHAEPFKFEQEYRPADGAAAMLTGTQPTLSMIGVAAGLDVLEGVDANQLRAKAASLSSIFIRQLEPWCEGHGIGFYSAKNMDARNGQVALTHESGYPIMQALIARGVIGDFRQPNILRFGFSPLFLTHANAFDAAMHLREVMETGEWKNARFQKSNLVT